MSCLPCTCSVCCCVSLGGRGLRLVIGYSDQASTVSQATTLELGHRTQMMQFSYLIPVSSPVLSAYHLETGLHQLWGLGMSIFLLAVCTILKPVWVSYLLPKDVRSARPCFLGFMEIMGLLERVTPGVGVRSADLAFSLIYCNRQNEKQVI